MNLYLKESRLTRVAQPILSEPAVQRKFYSNSGTMHRQRKLPEWKSVAIVIIIVTLLTVNN